MNKIPFDYRSDTPEEVRAVIQTLYENKHRARFFFGDLETGTAWMEECDVTGTVGKSTGSKPCALLINNARSLGGGALSTSSIVKIIDITARNMPYNSGVLYEHPTFNNPADNASLVMPSDLPEYVTNVELNGEVIARFHADKSAVNWLDFMQGKRFSK